jgi:16S rRNA (guanine966-N2)-methyltransferase
MRIIAGRLGGRQFDSPHGHRTHPMSEKMRGALFNALGDISGLTVLDAFAGSGALSFEALSRGARSAIAIELDKGAHRTIIDNAEALGVNDRMEIIKASVASWLNRHPNTQFDIVLADPPYNDLQEKIIETKLAKSVKPSGLLILSLPPEARIVLSDSFEEVSKKDYGDGTLVFYRRLG